MTDSITDRVDDPSEAGVEYYVGLEHLDPESLKIRRWGVPEDVEATKLRFQPGDIIFGRRRAYQKKLAVAEFEGICSAHALVLRAREDVVDKDFLPFFMQSEVFFERAMAISVGSLSPTINWKTLAQQKFAIPPLDEQRRIAEMLWAADESGRHWYSALERLQETQAVFSFSLFAEMPAETPRVAATEVCEKITVGIVVKPASYYVPKGVPALRSLNVFPDRFVLDDVVELSESGHAAHQKSRLRQGDVVVVRSGRPGDAAVIGPELDGANCIDLIIVRPNERLRPEYLSRFLNSAFGRRQFASGTAGTAQQHFNVGEFKRLQIPLPSLPEQDRIVGILRGLNEEFDVLGRHIDTTKALSHRLREHLLFGQEV